MGLKNDVDIKDGAELARQFVELARGYKGDLNLYFSDEQLELKLEQFKQAYRHMTDEELKIFAQCRYKISESVAEFLVPRIRNADTLEKRIELGSFSTTGGFGE